MGVTFCEVMNEINLSQVLFSKLITYKKEIRRILFQVFLWLQEKSLFGEAALCFNPAPGLFFTSVDMVRLVSAVIKIIIDYRDTSKKLAAVPKNK